MTTIKYTLGLDIGIASVGAAVADDKQLHDLFVRTFNKAETKKKASKNTERREKRGIRKTLSRRKLRLKDARGLFVKEGLLPDTEPKHIQKHGPLVWELRAEGLDRLLNQTEWAATLYHLLKHRGFQSIRKMDSHDTEAGKALSAISRNEAMRNEGGYRTFGEMLARDQHFEKHKRNKEANYSHSINRQEIQHEMDELFRCQKALGNPHTHDEFHQSVTNLLMRRRPIASGDDILEKVGNCTFLSDEKRAPKATFRFAYFQALQQINHCKIIDQGRSRPLSETEREKALALFFTGREIKYKHLRKALDLADHQKFNITYPADDQGKAEGRKFFGSHFFISLKKALKSAGLETHWLMQKENSDKSDHIGFALTCYKTDEDIEQYLASQGTDPEVIRAVLGVSFNGFGHLSFAAIDRLLPHLEVGLTYDKALEAEQMIPYFSRMKRQRYLPAPDSEVIVNPVVYRSVNQARKLVNAIIKKYGPPAAIHIELARDLAKSKTQREEISKGQEKYRKEKKAAEKDFKNTFGYAPKGQDLLKYRLYKQQDGQCLYSGKSFGKDLHRLFGEHDIAQIDHIIPLSRSFDDSLNNKVLVYTEENQNKGNRIPFEYFGDNDKQWRQFTARIETNKKINQAKRNRLLKQQWSNADADGFIDRNLNDTRYIGMVLKRMLEHQLQWHPSVTCPQCVVVQGSATAFLRSRWGLIKNREDSDKHHALDAAIVAVTTRALVKRISQFAKDKELAVLSDNYIDPETGDLADVTALTLTEKHFPLPWPDFTTELKARLSLSPVEILNGLPMYTPEQAQAVKPIRVSRMPERLGTGKAHGDTIHSLLSEETADGKIQTTIKTELAKLNEKNIEDFYQKDDPRNTRLFNELKNRLKAYDGKGEEAFKEPFYHPTKDGRQGPLVRSVKLYKKQTLGIKVRGGFAENEDSVRLDVFQKDGEFYFINLYVHHITQETLPNKIWTKGKPVQDWPDASEGFTFVYSLYRNDYVVIVNKKKKTEGYYSGFHITNGSVGLYPHDSRSKRIYAGAKTALHFHKYQVDLLGNIYRVKKETRQPLSKHQRVPAGIKA